jgi:hypothetical protein
MAVGLDAHLLDFIRLVADTAGVRTARTATTPASDINSARAPAAQ